MALALRANLTVIDLLNTITSLVLLFSSQILSLNAKLEVELSACLE